MAFQLPKQTAVVDYRNRPLIKGLEYINAEINNEY